MSLDRALQLELLKELESIYPRASRDFRDADEATYKNLFYLHQHDTVELKFNPAVQYGLKPIVFAAITQKGMDLLADDGGLSAVLGVVTIRFHEDTIRAMIEMKIHSSSASHEDKVRMIDTLRSLPHDSLKHLSMRLLDKAADNLPALFGLLGTIGA